MSGEFDTDTHGDFYSHAQLLNRQREEEALRNAQPVLPVTEPRNKREKYLKVFYHIVWTILVFGCAGIMFQQGYIEHMSRFIITPKPEFPPEFVPIPISVNMPAARCFDVDTAIVTNASARDKRVLDSLRYHMQKDDYESITAFHIGEPFCIILLRDIDGNILEMFNVEIRGFSIHNPVVRDEYSVACPGEKHYLVRAESITVTYINAKTQMHYVEVFKGKQAWALQAAVFYSHGKSICKLEGSNADLGLNTLAKDINSDAVIVVQK